MVALWERAPTLASLPQSGSQAMIACGEFRVVTTCASPRVILSGVRPRFHLRFARCCFAVRLRYASLRMTRRTQPNPQGRCVASGSTRGKGCYSLPRSCSTSSCTASQFDFACAPLRMTRADLALRKNTSLIKSVLPKEKRTEIADAFSVLLPSVGNLLN